MNIEKLNCDSCNTSYVLPVICEILYLYTVVSGLCVIEGICNLLSVHSYFMVLVFLLFFVLYYEIGIIHFI